MTSAAKHREQEVIIAERDVALLDYLQVLWRWKWLIIAGTLLAGLVACVAVALVPRTYRATVTLLIAESKIPPPQGGDPAATKISPETFEEMIKNKSVVAEAIQRFGLATRSPTLTPERFLQRHLGVERRTGANLLVLSVRLPDAKQAAETANFVAQRVVELNAALNKSDTLATKDYIQQQRASAKEVLEQAQAALVAFKREANLDSLHAEQRIALDAKARLTQLYAETTTKIQGLQANVAELRKAFTNQEPFLTAKKSIVSDPVMLMAARERKTDGLKDLSTVELKSQEINRVYQQIQGNLIKNEATLASLESQRQDVEHKQKENDRALAELEKRKAEADARLEELDRNYKLEKAAYELFATKFNEASFSVASRAADLKVVDPAIEPTQPYGLRPVTSVALAVIAGLLLCVFLAFFLEYFQQSRGAESS
jgi:uncharacterized protein involved in exopolysaccharide biosynthesis